MIPFYKYEGTGNDFIILDNVLSPNDNIDVKKMAPQICDRHFGIGADGLLLLKKEKGQWTWDFYNSDGSHASMCGNASRCVALHIYRRHNEKTGTLKTGAGTIAFSYDGKQAEVEMTAPKDYRRLDKKTVFVNTGVPHFVIQLVEKNKESELDYYIKEYRWHSIAGSDGANVSFITNDDETNEYYAKTFERGVEDFTLACGTGAVACGLVLMEDTQDGEVSIRMPGGPLLISKRQEKVYLAGPANFICQGEYNV